MQNPARIRISLRARLTVIGVVGVRLLRYDDIIARKSGTRRGGTGLILRSAWRGLRAVSRSGLLRVGYRLNTLFLYRYGD